MIGQYTILAHHRHDIRGDAHSAEVEQRGELVELYAIAHSEGLHKLEPYATPRKVGVGVMIVAPLGIKNGHSTRQLIVGHMVIADNEIDTLTFSISYLLYSLNTTVEHDNKSYASLRSKIDTFLRDTITLFIAIGDVEIDVGVVLQQKLVDQGNGCTAIHIVVAIHEDALFAAHSQIKAIHCLLHIIHKEGIMQFRQLRTEKVASFLRRMDAPLEE